MITSESAEKSRLSGVAGMRRAAAIFLGIAMLTAAPLAAWGDCKPKRALPKIVLKSMGPCAFDPEQLQFAGDGKQQTSCLIQPVAKRAKLEAPLDAVPEVFAVRVGQSALLPSREALHTYLSAQGLADDFAAHLSRPIARANDNDETAPMARYLVIHDTSGPFLGVTPFPINIDTHRKINNLAGHRCEDGWESAHVVINRSGGMLLGHELAVPWRATKFERAVDFNGRLKGLFLHVEMIQPRHGEYRMVKVKRKGRRGRWVRRGAKNDAIAPMPGFSAAQYDRLALVYTVASVRAERWLIPAFHAVIDNHIRGGHDDPQNFQLAKFAASLERLTERLRAPTQSADGPDAMQPDTTASVPSAMEENSTMTTDRKKQNGSETNEATEANEAMNREFGKDRGTPRKDADDIKGDAVQEANDAARARRPLP